MDPISTKIVVAVEIMGAAVYFVAASKRQI
jgi:hypothetical protein